MAEHPEVPSRIVARVRARCLALPEAYEEPAWVGTRWRIRTKTFAHVVHIDGGWPPAYARAAGDQGPLTVLTFRAAADEVEVLTNLGRPFFSPVWWPDIVGLVLDDATDWTEVDELVTESYCVMAPKKLAALVERPNPG